MKYLTFLTVLTTGFASTYAQEENPLDASLGDNIRSFLNETSNALQNIEMPTLGEGKYLQTLSCDAKTIAGAPCTLLEGVEGINVCRMIAGIELTLCAPKVFDQYIGSAGDKCGCCGGSCLSAQYSNNACACSCQEGQGVLVNHNLFTIFGQQISWKGCYSPTIAANVMNARAEFSCYTGCTAEEGSGVADDGAEEALDAGIETYAPTDEST